MPNISIGIQFADINLVTPFIIASGPYSTAIGEIHKHVENIAKNGWGGLVTKTIISNYGTEVKPHLWSSPEFKLIGMQNAGPAMTLYNKPLMEKLKKDAESAHAAGIVLFVSIIGSSYDEWGEMAYECEKAGADGIELNLSCPSSNVAIQSSMGGFRVGQSPELSARAVEATISGTSLPVIAKMTPHAPDIVAVAKACVGAGSRAISGINTVRGIIGVDVWAEKPLSADLLGRCYYSGLSGPLIKSISLGICADLALAIGVPISAMGGVVKWQDAVEYILVGASTVQVCTGVMWYGFALGNKLRQGLIHYMADKQYRSIQDFRGNALRHITSERPAGYPSDWHLELLPDKCNICQLCLVACRDNSSGAIRRVKGTLHIDRSKCNLCGLCLTVCKNTAITLRRKSDSGEASRTACNLPNIGEG